MSKKRIGILTGGGDVSPLNAVIGSARDEAIERGIGLVGFIKGWAGVLDNQWVDLSGMKVNPRIGGTILKSSRVRLEKSPEGVERASRNLRSLNLEGLIVIGGEDTLSNSFSLPDFPQVLISKTIDNDVGTIPSAGDKSSSSGIVNYFTLGYPTAARKISSFVSLKEGLRTTAYSHERIFILESMGMHAGWLALSSSMGHPDFIVVPEFPLDYERLKDRIIARYKEQRHVIAVVAEGARLNDGNYISADEDEKDDFGHPRFKGSAEALSRRLKEDLKKYFDTRNVNGINPSYLYRSGAPCELDLRWARELGREAIALIGQGLERPVLLTIRKDSEEFSLAPYSLSSFNGIKGIHRFVDERFYDPDTYSITEKGRGYLSAIIEEIQEEDYGLRR